MRASGIRGLLIYCSHYHCSHWTTLSADRWPDDVRLSDIELRFTCQGLQPARCGCAARLAIDWSVCLTRAGPTNSKTRSRSRGVANSHTSGCGRLHHAVAEGRAREPAMAGSDRGTDHGGGRSRARWCMPG